MGTLAQINQKLLRVFRKIEYYSRNCRGPPCKILEKIFFVKIHYKHNQSKVIDLKMMIIMNFDKQMFSLKFYKWGTLTVSKTKKCMKIRLVLLAKILTNSGTF